jgi:hypothetical protein
MFTNGQALRKSPYTSNELDNLCWRLSVFDNFCSAATRFALERVLIVTRLVRLDSS